MSKRSDTEDPEQAPPPRYGEVWWFFFPLAVTLSLITFSHTLVNGALGRLPRPEAALAGYAVAKSIMQLAQNPSMMVRQVVTSLVVDEQSFQLVRKIVYRLMVVMAGAIALLGWTPLGARILQSTMGLEGEALRQAAIALRVFAVFPFISVNRNLGQGLAILARANHLVPVATLMRLLSLAGVLALLVRWRPLPGAALGAVAFTVTMLVEAAVLYGVGGSARRELRRRRVAQDSPPSQLTPRQVLQFYVPLMGTTFAAALTMPLVQAGISRSTGASAELQIAAFAVALGLSMVITSPANMLHQTSLTFTASGTADAYSRTLRFALAVGFSLSAATAAIGLSPLGLRFLAAGGATPQIIDASRRALQVFALWPLTRAWREHCWGVLMQKRETGAITFGKAINMAATVLVMVLGLVMGTEQTALLGASALVIGETIEGVVLHRRLRAVLGPLPPTLPARSNVRRASSLQRKS